MQAIIMYVPATTQVCVKATTNIKLSNTLFFFTQSLSTDIYKSGIILESVLLSSMEVFYDVKWILCEDAFSWVTHSIVRLWMNRPHALHALHSKSVNVFPRSKLLPADGIGTASGFWCGNRIFPLAMHAVYNFF